MTKQVYDHEQGKHRVIETDDYCPLFWYDCTGNHDVHVVSEPSPGYILIEYLGDFNGDLMPAKKSIKNMTDEQALLYAESLYKSLI